MRLPAVRRGFTLIELLVVLAIIALLIGLLVPAVQKVRESAARAQCVNNLKQIALALHGYHDAQHTLPPGYFAALPYVAGATETSPGWGWAAFLLPYLEQGNLFVQLNFAQPIPASPAGGAVVKLYLCPSDQSPPGAFPVPDGFGNTLCLAGPTSYAACCGGDESDTTAATGLGVFYRNSRTRLTDITDGTSQTILIGERAWANANGTWVGAVPDGVIRRGASNPCQPNIPGAWYPAATLVLAHAHGNNPLVDADGSAGMDDFSSKHPGGSNFAFADGSVHFILSMPSDNPDGTYPPLDLEFQALGTRANGEVVSEWDFVN